MRELAEIQVFRVRHPDLRERPAVFGILSPAQDNLRIQPTHSDDETLPQPKPSFAPKTTLPLRLVVTAD